MEWLACECVWFCHHGMMSQYHGMVCMWTFVPKITWDDADMALWNGTTAWLVRTSMTMPLWHSNMTHLACNHMYFHLHFMMQQCGLHAHSVIAWLCGTDHVWTHVPMTPWHKTVAQGLGAMFMWTSIHHSITKWQCSIAPWHSTVMWFTFKHVWPCHHLMLSY